MTELDLSGWTIDFHRDAWGTWSWRAESLDPPDELRSGWDSVTKESAEAEALRKITRHVRGEDFDRTSGTELQARVSGRALAERRP